MHTALCVTCACHVYIPWYGLWWMLVWSEKVCGLGQVTNGYLQGLTLPS